MFSLVAVSPCVALFITRLAVVGLLLVDDTTTGAFSLAAADETGWVGTRFGIWTRFGMTVVVCGWNWNTADPSLVGVRRGLLSWGCCCTACLN